MSLCGSSTKAGTPCTRSSKEGSLYCWQHGPKETVVSDNTTTTKISGKRQIGDFSLFDTTDPTNPTDIQKWEDEYVRIMDPKYAKGTRNFSRTLTGTEWTRTDEPPIFLVPRTRGGPSYKSIPLSGVTSDDVSYQLISKGYPSQDVSSFTLGPIIGEGLCLVNSAFSKSICVMHIEGGGRLDLSRKCFWRRARTPTRRIEVVNSTQMIVDGYLVDIHDWLRQNELLWLEQWELWRRSIALASVGDFHWCESSPTVAYRYQGQYLDFVSWKKECYIRPSYELLPSTSVFKFLQVIWRDHRRPLGLVHPKAISEHPETPVTQEYLEELFNSPYEMCCQPFVVAGLLLGVQV